jgi:hypothetical protein
MGERPTNPSCLSSASTFVKDGMSIEAAQSHHVEFGHQLGSRNDETNFAKDSGNRSTALQSAAPGCRGTRDSVLGISGNLTPRCGGPPEDLNAQAAYGLRESEPLQAECVSADSIFLFEHQRREAVHDGPATALVPHEQRLHADRGGGAGEAGCQWARQSGANSCVSAHVWS